MTLRPRRAIPVLALALMLATIAGAPASDPVATDACGEIGAPEADPDRTPAPAGETVPALDVCTLHVAATWSHTDDTTTLDAVAFTITLAGDAAERPAGAQYAVGWTAPNQGRECYHVVWFTEPVVGEAHAEVGGSCPTGNAFPGAYEFLDGALPVDAVELDGRTVTFTVELATADPVLTEAITAGGTLARPSGQTYLDTGVPDFHPTEALWDLTTETRDVLLAPPA